MKDALRYFRVEARELLDALQAGVLELERSGSPEGLPALLRAAHTLKGAARVVRQNDIADLAHTLEDEFAALREGGGEVSRNHADRLLSTLDRLAEKVRSLAEPLAPQASTGSVEAEDVFGDTVRVETRAVDRLLESVSDLDAMTARLGRQVVELARAQRLAAWLEERVLRPGGGNASPGRLRDAAEELGGVVTEVKRALESVQAAAGGELARLREDVTRLRLIPVSVVFPLLERAARDAASELDRQVSFSGRGGAHRLDGQVLSMLREALLHLVRNAVAHGIEPAERRVAEGKPAEGQITLEVDRRGEQILIAVADDGGGIDFDAVRRAAEAAGDSQARTAEISELLFRPGLTTAEDLSSVAGRGVGLDVAAEAVRRMGGRIEVASEKGKGTRFELIVPLSLSSLTAMIVGVRGLLLAIPLDAISRAIRPEREARDAAAVEGVRDGDRVLPFAALASLFGGTPRDEACCETVLVIETGERSLAVGIERLVGLRHLVLHPPPELIGDAPLMGAALDVDGTPLPVLDPPGLVRRLREAPRRTPEQAEERPAPLVLVCDDSLTTRMLERSILESAGYRVELAASAEEALEMAARQRYDLFLVDVEMPGMDGFDFVARTREDGELKGIPAIIVTSRSSPEDKARAEQVGAKGYEVKGEFDQERLLNLIARLTRERP